MGGAFASGIAQGLGQGIQQGMERKQNKEYREALVTQAKAQAKYLEAQEVLKKGELAKTVGLFQMAGMEPPPALTQAMNAPLTMTTAPQEQKPKGLLGMIGQAFSGGQPQTAGPQPMPTPPPQAPTQTTQPVSETGRGSNILSQMPPDVAKAYQFDLAMKGLFDMSPQLTGKILQRKLEEGDVTQKIDLGNQVLLLNKSGQPIGAIPKAMEYEYKETQPTPGGPTMYQPISKYPGAVQPFIKEQPKGETAEQAGKTQAIIGGLQDGMKFLETIQDKKTGEINQGTIAGMTAPLMGSLGGMPGTKAREGLSLFRNAVDAIVRQRTGAQIRADEWPYYNSIYLPDYKDSPDLQREKINRLNRDLAGALGQTDPGQVKQGRSLGKIPKLPMTPDRAAQELINRGYKKDPNTGQWVK